ncbi:class I SAM-dependent methyltransferase [Nocardioides sp. CPCC 205120]|uniref:class I SAM-dependent methyltransferase n=1 Tax=Nocardioides sp. CPCC 205120 TaxID=3406462 RepID=UPI003B5072A9
MSDADGTLWQRVARAQAGDDYARAYAERFRAIERDGGDVHGEAALVRSLVPAPARVLDAGCGTGRLTVRLAADGYDVVGCDVDAAMVEVARAEAPEHDWRVADLASLDLGTTFDAVVLAGNVLPLLEPGTLDGACVALARHVAPGGLLVAGFGLDAGHLPAGCPVTPLGAVDAAMAAAGLRAGERWGGWAREPLPAADPGYVVATYRP